MIVCPRCSKENQDHYKFCLGCGSELPREAVQAPKDFSTPTPPAGIRAAEFNEQPKHGKEKEAIDPTEPPPEKQMELANTQVGGSTDPSVPDHGIQPPLEEAPVILEESACPHCGNPVPQDFKFCGTCGYNMQDKSVPSEGVAGVISKGAAVEEQVPTQDQKPDDISVSDARSEATVRGELVLINPDGTEGSKFELFSDSTTVGRNTGGPFAGDMYLSPLHANIIFRGDQLFIVDQHSLNGVYVKIGRNSPVPISNGAIFRIGQEILRYEELGPGEEFGDVEVMGSPNPGYIGRLCTLIGRDTIGEAFAIPSDGMHLGRERGDVTFPEDGYVSGLHCRIYREGNSTKLLDVGSSNGTFLRVSGEQQLRNGELVLMGQQLFSVRF